MGIKAKVKRQYFNGIKNAVILSAVFFSQIFLGTVFAEEPPAGPAQQEKDFEALKEEWEQVREQQIQVLREKEEQLEKLKEELFVKMKTPPVSPETAVAAAQADLARELEKTKAEGDVVKAKEKELAQREQTLLDLQAQLEQKRDALEAKEMKLNKKAAPVIPAADNGPAAAEERAELERQKAAFQEERQKFFHEMTRQKAKLLELQSAREQKAEQLAVR